MGLGIEKRIASLIYGETFAYKQRGSSPAAEQPKVKRIYYYRSVEFRVQSSPEGGERGVIS